MGLKHPPDGLLIDVIGALDAQIQTTHDGDEVDEVDLQLNCKVRTPPRLRALIAYAYSSGPQLRTQLNCLVRLECRPE